MTATPAPAPTRTAATSPIEPAADAGSTERALRLLDSLVAMPTVAGQPNRELIDFVGARLDAVGVPSTVLASSSRPDGFNLHALIGPPDQPGVLLAAHTDVVAVDGQRWQSDPFALTRAGDRLYGRGTSDMKGFIAAVLASAERAAARPLRRPLQIALSCDEELGCAGVGSLLDALAAAPVLPAICVVGEPTQMRIADRHKGKVRLGVEVRGRAVHSAAAPRGVNAVTCAARLIVALSELDGELAAGPWDPAFAVQHATLSVGPISGGVSTNIVPDECSFEFELRHLPGQDPEPVLARAREQAAALRDEMRALAPEAGIELRRLSAYPALSASPALAASRTTGALALLPTDCDRDAIAVDFGTEAGLYHERLGVAVIVCGPGDMARAHRADEYIELGELAAAQRFLDGMVDRLCEG